MAGRSAATAPLMLRFRPGSPVAAGFRGMSSTLEEEWEEEWEEQEEEGRRRRTLCCPCCRPSPRG